MMDRILVDYPAHCRWPTVPEVAKHAAEIANIMMTDARRSDSDRRKGRRVEEDGPRCRRRCRQCCWCRGNRGGCR